MPREVSKKRKLDSGRGSSSASGSTSRDVKKFQSDLKRCDASAIMQGLADTLSDIPHENLQILRQILGPLLEADAKPKHCVRCHQSYHEAENARESCVVRCGSPESLGYQDKQHEWYCMMRTPCCNKLVSGVDPDDFESEDDELICYRAKHTTDPKTVKYYHSRYEKREEGLNYWGENESVNTCWERGCGRGKEKSGRQAKRRKRASTPSGC